MPRHKMLDSFVKIGAIHFIISVGIVIIGIIAAANSEWTTAGAIATGGFALLSPRK